MKKIVALALLATTAMTSSAQAADYLTGYAGAFNFNEQGGSDSTGLFGIEYRAEAWDFGIRPTVGASVDGDGDLYGYLGFNWDVPLGTPFIITPSFMVGLYDDNGGLDMGGAIEFRSGIEVAYQFENQQRLGVHFNHMSNAGIYDENPGTENVVVTYSVPLGSLFGN